MSFENAHVTDSYRNMIKQTAVFVRQLPIISYEYGIRQFDHMSKHFENPVRFPKN